jgi:hypothetical protein
LHREGGGRARSNDHVDLERYEFGEQRRKAIISSLGPTKFDDDVLALEIAKVAQPLAKRVDEVLLSFLARSW